MSIKERSRISLGILFILTAIVLIIYRVDPRLGRLLHIEPGWPTWILIGGAGLLVIGLLSGVPDMAIPSCIIIGLGGIFYYQNANQDWTSWSYMWTLLPGFVGIGIIFSGIFAGRFNKSLLNSLRLILISLILFCSLAAILNKQVFWNSNREIILAIILLLLGVLLVLRAIIKNKTQT